MKSTFANQLKSLQEIAFLSDTLLLDKKIDLLESMKHYQWKKIDELKAYQEVLLFMVSHSENEKHKFKVEQEFKRLTSYFKKNKEEAIELKDAGLPFTRMVTRFSHDMISFLNSSSICKLSIEGYDEDAAKLNTVLSFTLPSVERDETSIGLENDELLELLQVKPNHQLKFLIDQFSLLNKTPAIKDYHWESIKCWVNIDGKNEIFSRFYNRMPCQSYFFQDKIIKKFDAQELIKNPIPEAIALTKEGASQLANIIKNSLVLTMRETDPSTFMDMNTLRYYALERGISIAIYGMEGSRQLPLQSYIGYTVFKNGYPVAYGGSWILGRFAMFGLNIFEAFRGGESGYIMCQLLRVYSQVFGIHHFEVEPYQFGRDNPDGIKSGAYWFYYRYGFRSIDKKLAILAEKEQFKIKSSSKYRTKEATLIQFTDSGIALRLSNQKPISIALLMAKVTSMIRKEFKSDRLKAIEICVQEFSKQCGQLFWKNGVEESALHEIALLAYLLKITNTKKIELLSRLIHLKPVDPYRYNELLILVLNE